MKIRKEQMDAFRSAEHRACEARIAELLRECFRDAREVPPDELAGLVHERAARAAQHGFTTDRQVATFVAVSWALGADFDTRVEGARALLADGERSPGDKARELGKYLDAAPLTAPGSV